MPTRSQASVFFLIALVLCSWHVDQLRNDNTHSRAATVAALTHDHSMRIDNYAEGLGDKAVIDGHTYSDKAPLPALLVTPVHMILEGVGAIGDPLVGIPSAGTFRLGGLICGSIPLALLMTLVWMQLMRHGNARYAYLLATVPMLGSFLFVYSGTFFGHLIGGLFVVLGYLSMTREKGALAGIFLGAAVMCEYTLAVFAVFWVVRMLVLKRYSTGAAMIMGGLFPLAILLIHNVIITGSALDFAYKHVPDYSFMQEAMGLGLPSLKALWGLTFSPYRGLFIYAPALLVIMAYWLIKLPNFKAVITDPVLPVVLLQLLVIAGYAMWWGGWAFGPRHLTASAALLFVAGIDKLAGSKRWTIATLIASVFGLVIAFMAKSTLWYDLPTEVMDPLTSMVLPAFAHGQWSDRFWVIEFFGASKAFAVWSFVPLLLVGMIGLYLVQRSVKPTSGIQ